MPRTFPQKGCISSIPTDRNERHCRYVLCWLPHSFVSQPLQEYRLPSFRGNPPPRLSISWCPRSQHQLRSWLGIRAMQSTQENTAEYYRDVRILDEIDDGGPHATGEALTCHLPERGCRTPYPRNPMHILRNAQMNGIHLLAMSTVNPSQRIDEEEMGRTC
jgi:hypothetical protein